MRRLRRITAAIALLSAVVGSCGGSPASTQPATTSSTAKIGIVNQPQAGIPPRTSAPTTTEASVTTRPVADERGQLAIVVTDGEGRARPGVVVVADGPVHAEMVSSDGGLAKAVVPVGEYTVSVPARCLETFEVTKGGTGQATVAIDRTTRGAITVSWRHRFAPDTSTRRSRWIGSDGSAGGGLNPSMKAGIVYDITFAVADRCAGNALVPKASLAMFALEVSPNAEQVDDSIGPADDGGFGSVHIRCHDRGAVSARLYDTDNPDDSADLLINSNGMGRPSCATP